MNRYRVMLPLLVHTEDASYKQGEEFEKDFTPDEETASVASGLLEIVPQTYKVVGGSRVHDTNPGDTFTRALTLNEEALLVSGGHIERVEQPAPAHTKKPKEAKD